MPDAKRCDDGTHVWGAVDGWGRYPCIHCGWLTAYPNRGGPVLAPASVADELLALRRSLEEEAQWSSGFLDGLWHAAGMVRIHVERGDLSESETVLLREIATELEEEAGK